MKTLVAIGVFAVVNTIGLTLVAPALTGWQVFGVTSVVVLAAGLMLAIDP